MRKLFLVLAVAATSLFGAAAATAPAAQAPIAHAACTRAIILGQHKCIARGQYCTHTTRANRDYHRYGYHCGRRDYNGRYHLVYY